MTQNRFPKNRVGLSSAIAVIALAVTGCPQTTPDPITQDVPVPAKIESFKSSLPSVVAGQSVTLSWTTKDAQSISLTTATGEKVAGVDGTKLNGSVEVTLQESSVFLLTARGEGGSDQAVV